MRLGAWGATLSAHGSYKHAERRATEGSQRTVLQDSKTCITRLRGHSPYGAEKH